MLGAYQHSNSRHWDASEVDFFTQIATQLGVALQQAQYFFFTTKPIGKGTGLGLSISYQIVEKHGGKLHCESQLGEGTEFLINIPLMQMVN